MGSIEVAFNGNTSLSSQVTGVAHRDSDNAYVANNLFYQTPNSILGYQVAGTQVVGPQVTGWTAGTGTKSLGAFNADTTRTIGGSYSQTDVQGIQDDLKTARQRILALETAMRSHGLIN